MKQVIVKWYDYSLSKGAMDTSLSINPEYYSGKLTETIGFLIAKDERNTTIVSHLVEEGEMAKGFIMIPNSYIVNISYLESLNEDKFKIGDMIYLSADINRCTYNVSSVDIDHNLVRFLYTKDGVVEESEWYPCECFEEM